MPAKPYLDDRIVYCANCEANRLLRRAPQGPVCSSCFSIHWMFLPQVAVNAFRRVVELSTPGLAPVAAVAGAVARRVVEMSKPRLAPIPVG